MYRLMIKCAAWLAGAGFFSYLALLLAARSDGPGGVQIPLEFQLLILAVLVFLGVVVGCANIIEAAGQRQRVAMTDDLRRDLGTFLKEEITVWITRSDAHSRTRVVEEVTEILGHRIDVAVRSVSGKSYHAGLNQGFAKGFATVATVPRQDVPQVLGSNVFHLAPRDTEE